MRNFKTLLIALFMLVGVNQIDAQCNAGNDVTVNPCAGSGAVDLFTQITGGPMSGGFWLDPSGAGFTNPFDPAVHVGGIYLYIITSDLAGNVCAVYDTAFVAVSIVAVPTVTFTMDDNEGCGQLEVQFNNTSSAPGYTFCSWDFGDGTTSSVCNPLHQYAEVGCYDVTLSLSSSLGCTASTTVNAAACVLEAPIASFEIENNPVSTTNPVAIITDHSTLAQSYEYIVPGVGNYTEPSPQITLPALEDSYFTCQEIIAANGCRDSYCTSILVREDVQIFIPSAFTPNKDRVNESFKPTLSFKPQQYELIIFDRWGKEVFRSEDPELGWNGANKVSEYYANDSYYSYKLKIVKDGEVLEHVGQITLIR